MEVSSHKDSASEFCCVGSIFFNEVVAICKAVNILSTELVHTGVTCF